MLFNSLEYAMFLPVVAAIYFLLPQRLRTVHLLAASCVFYMAFIPAYVLILALTIVIDYFAGLWIERTQGRRRKTLLWISIAATCTVLFVFKYFYFFTDSFVGLVGLFGWPLSSPSVQILLPIGLSFHTFQSLSYVIEVYRGNQRAEPDFIKYATFVMFFPQLVAGPIERPQNLLHQFTEHHSFDYERVASGLRRIAWGLFKKVVIADRLALYVNDVYGAPQQHNGLQLTIATVFFAYQIYCDFSGYSDIAIGSARVLGFRLIENFDRPYSSRSISEFWKRWHISLSSWFRDYVYIPLGGNRRSPARHRLNLLVTFTASGLWHGANWTYVFWGALNGLYLICGTALRARTKGLQVSWLQRLAPALAVWWTFLLVCLAWILFRARSLSDAFYIVTHLFGGWSLQAIATEHFLSRQFPVAIFAIVALETIQYRDHRQRIQRCLSRWSLAPRWLAYSTLFLGVLVAGVYQKTNFIYFQF